MELICKYCGESFITHNYKTKKREICDNCIKNLYHSPTESKQKNGKPNAKLLEEVREATKHKLSYGQWKGKQS